VSENDREHFLKITKGEIAALHEGNFARYRLRPAEYNDWQKQKKSDLSRVQSGLDIFTF